MQMRDLTWVEIQAVLQKDDVVLIPIGSLEQHGYHSAIWFDSAIADVSAKIIGERKNVLVAPTVPLGNARSLMGFPGGASIDPELISEILYEIAEGYIKQGAKKILFINSHGGNASGVKMACDNLYNDYGAVCVQAEWYAVLEQNSPYTRNDHGGELGTSLVLALDDSLLEMEKAKTVKMKDLTDKLVYGDSLTYQGVGVYLAIPVDHFTEVGNYGPEAELATKEKGQEMAQIYIDYCCELVDSLRALNL